MAATRPASMVAGCDSWARASHYLTAIEGVTGDLTLTWVEPEPVRPPGGAHCLARGLAVDRFCRVYRLAAAAVDRLAVGPTVDGLDYARLPEPIRIIGAAAGGLPATPSPEFCAVPSDPAAEYVGVAIDDDDRVFLADETSATIAVVDSWSRRLLRSVSVASPRQPDRVPGGLGAAPDSATVFAVVRRPAGLLRLSASRGPVELPLPAEANHLPAGSEPRRVTLLPDGTPVLLFVDPAGDGWLVVAGRDPRHLGRTSDIAVDATGALVVAPCLAADGSAMFRRLVPAGRDWERAQPLDATGYTGGGLVALPGGRIGYFAAGGFRLAVTGRVTYVRAGHCVTYRLDSRTPRNQWGRVLVEACIPGGTACLVGAVSSDEEHPMALPHVEAEPAQCEPAVPAATPPLPPPDLAATAFERAGGLHERPRPVTPWWPVTSSYSTYEAPVHAPPGRYLWLTLRLTGDTRRTPRVRDVRVEHRDHTLLRRLPAVFSEDGARADFLRRFLGPLDGFLHDLDLAARCRDILVDPHGTPVEALDWLASFVGLVLDRRWAPAARRQLVAEIVPLYRRRGTTVSLSRYIELFLAGEHAGRTDRQLPRPVIVEHFRLRGLGGPLLGEEPVRSNRSVLGFGFRVGGATGDLDGGLSGPAGPEAAFLAPAHRFSVLIPRPLGSEEESAIRHMLDTERPAHTAYELCTVDAGMRIGDGLHLGLSSIVGPTGAFEPAVTDRTLLGRRSVLGGRATGVAVEANRADMARVG